jgi:hypothetical protein
VRRIGEALADLRRRGGADVIAGFVLVVGGLVAIVVAALVALLG